MMNLPFEPFAYFKRYAKSTPISSSIVIFLIALFVTQYYLRFPYNMMRGVGDINFAIHEFGHIMVMSLPVPFIVISAAGTFLQLLVPIVFSFYVLFRRRYLEAAFFFAWLGTNLQYVGIYMKDTILDTMPMSTLFGPVAIHDWEYMFRMMRVERHAIEIGNVVLFIGNSMMVLSTLYIFILILTQIYYKKIKRESQEKPIKKMKIDRY